MLSPSPSSSSKQPSDSDSPRSTMENTTAAPEPGRAHIRSFSSDDPLSHTASGARSPVSTGSSTPVLTSPLNPSPSPRVPLRSASAKSFASSPLNPMLPPASPFARPGSRGSAHITRIASEDSRALSMASPAFRQSLGSRGSMILYRMADIQDDGMLVPPTLPHANRNSIASTSADSYVSLSSDSKYPSGMMSTTERGIVAYAYDPAVDELEPMNDEDVLHDPKEKIVRVGGCQMPVRGVTNIAALVALILGIISLFVVYPVISFYRDNGRNSKIVGNIRINSTGQAVEGPLDGNLNTRSQVFLKPDFLIDPVTPEGVRHRRGSDGGEYELVFSDEFDTEGRTFHKGDDGFWEAAHDEAHDSEQVTTHSGRLTFSVDRLAPGEYLGGLLKGRTSICVRHGFIDVGLSWPSGDDVRVMWAGRGWSATNADVPAGLSLDRDYSVELMMGVSPQPLIPPNPTVDYVRIYQRSGDSHRLLGPCDGAIETVSSYLNIQQFSR
ncbi:beta-glucan synthesis-associated protein-domain-containing protein [Infundibulicybe gibba]|nr:beta-glucan synthesis-associated protein-domain-containing protein [Infundibulicybe gibba]